MTTLSWNCRGLAAPPTIQELKGLCKVHRPAILFLMETRAPRGRVENMKRRLKFQHCFTVDPRGLPGGLALLLKDDVHVQIFSSFPNFIHTSVSFKDNSEEYDCSFVYGNPVFNQRRGFWSRLMSLQGNKKRPWCCVGDFNEILACFEKLGVRPHHPRRAELFRDFLNISGLMDMELQGCAFTWMSNPRNGVVTKEKLDRILVNWPWRRGYSNACAVALPIVSSDHSPIILLPKPKEKSGVSFKFEAFWADHEQCQQVVERSWGGVMEEAEPWQTVKKKLEATQKALQYWHKNTFRKADDEICRLKQRLNILIDREGDALNTTKIRRIQKEMDELWHHEECCWSQRARVKWLQDGDRNTKFFHATTIQRRGRNRIKRIQNARGDWIEGKDNIFNMILDHFEEVYRSDTPDGINACLANIPLLVTPQMNETLMAPVTEGEIKQAVFCMGPLKAPGPDGFNGLFCQRNWDQVNGDVCKAVLDFFNGGNLPENLNETVVTLIPKVPLPESINHLRPISCCNFVYKIISKLIVMRLKGFMGELISPNQSAFVGGRLIQDNLTVAH